MKKFTLVVLMLFTALSYAQGIELNGTISAQGNQIKNVADPVDDQDAVTKTFFQAKIDELTLRIENLENAILPCTPFFT